MFVRCRVFFFLDHECLTCVGFFEIVDVCKVFFFFEITNIC